MANTNQTEKVSPAELGEIIHTWDWRDGFRRGNVTAIEDMIRTYAKQIAVDFLSAEEDCSEETSAKKFHDFVDNYQYK
jgi:hypothetical protein